MASTNVLRSANNSATVLSIFLLLLLITHTSTTTLQKQISLSDDFQLVTQTMTFSGSTIGAKRPTSLKAEFQIDWDVSTKEGFTDPHQVVMAFYKANEQLYQQTKGGRELFGMVVKSTDNRYFVTNTTEVPGNFKLRAAVRLPKGWKTQDAIHTHPPMSNSQERFSTVDRKAVLKGLPGYYLRTPLGDVRFLDKELAKSTRNKYGAAGETICEASNTCMAKHQHKVSTSSTPVL